MQLKEASLADADRLSDFFKDMTFPGPVEMKIFRPHGFFSPYEVQSDDYVTYILEDERSEILAMATLIFREGWIGKERQTIGFATDLRVKKSRKASLGWAQHFLPILEDEQKKRNCPYFFSILGKDQILANNSFVRPRSPRRKMPRYYHYRKFSLVSIHGIWPFAPAPLASVEFRPATINDQESLGAYISKKHKQSPIGFSQTPEEFNRNLDLWQDLSIEDFIVALDSKQNIIGCAAPWSSHSSESYFVKRYTGRAKTLQDLLNVGSLFRLAHPLPREGDCLDFLYLTHLHANNPDIFYSILHYCFRSLSRSQLLIYPYFEGNWTQLPPRAMISAMIPYGLYCLLSQEQSPPEFLKPQVMGQPPLMELAFF